MRIVLYGLQIVDFSFLIVYPLCNSFLNSSASLCLHVTLAAIFSAGVLIYLNQ
jgi:hypothetical protein